MTLARSLRACYHFAMQKDSKFYEIFYLIKPIVSEDEAIDTENRIRTILGAHKAEIESWDAPRKARLAYPMGEEGEAYRGAIRFHVSPEHTKSIQDKLKTEKNIIRTMLSGWKKIPERVPVFPRPVVRKEEPVPTDEKALEEKLEEIFGKDSPHEPQ